MMIDSVAKNRKGVDPMSIPAEKTEKKFTYGDYLTWSDDERWEIIDGVSYVMTPAPTIYHQRISVNLIWSFKEYLKDKAGEVFHAPIDVLLPWNDEKDTEVETVVQPDLVVVCDRSRLVDDRAFKGAPDLVVEILSPSTAGKDRKIKRELYQRAGVREFWIIDPNGKTVEVFCLDGSGKYGSPDVYTPEDKIKVGILEDLTIDLRQVFEDIHS
jgi:Uma2 family endonuclease